MMLILMLALWAPADTTAFAEFVEPDFPFITTTVNADSLSDFTPAYNWSVRCVVVRLGGETYACWDPDLLRLAIAWKGDFLSLVTMAQVSYHRIDKGNSEPVVLGDPIVATGMHPGWMGEDLAFDDPRPPGPDPSDPGRGPLPETFGRYKGIYVSGSDVLLSYNVRGVNVLEQIGRVEREGEVGISRTFELQSPEEKLHVSLADIPGGSPSFTGDMLLVAHGTDSVTAFSASGGRLKVEDEHVLIEVPRRTRSFRALMWTGPRSRLAAFQAMRTEPIRPAEKFGPRRWSASVTTSIQIAPDSLAFVYDDIALPLANPWRRNVRPADIDFFSDGRAAVVTFDGDIWVVEGLSGSAPEWRRFASGLYEPLSIAVVADTVYAYGREGIVRFHDLNADGEADYYEAFAPGVIQSTHSREWPFGLVPRPGGGFFASMGGALQAPSSRRPPVFMSGFFRGSAHSGSVLEISPEGAVSVVATGFRAPYLGIHPQSGMVTISDQEGNFVPTTPIYALKKGAYYGVTPTAHRPDPLPPAERPITWIPHQVDPSSTSQVWITSTRLGSLSGRMVHLSYGRSRLYRVYVDSASTPVQGGISPILDDERSPTLNAAVNPADGLLYVTGFQIWGSQAQKLTSMRRLRYTGLPSALPEELLAGEQGVVLRFEGPLRKPEPADFRVRRWNYVRSESYGSGHYRLDGSPGEEELEVAATHLSRDRRSLLLIVPDMREVMQMAVDYRLQNEAGDSLRHSVYFTMNAVRELELSAFDVADWRAELSEGSSRPVREERAVEPTALRGRHLYTEIGCAACHSMDGTAAGKLGPTFSELYGSQRRLEGDRKVVADEDYIRRSIVNPAAQVVAGFDQEMPSYRGILDEEEVESIVLFIKSLASDATDQ